MSTPTARSYSRAGAVLEDKAARRVDRFNVRLNVALSEESDEPTTLAKGGQCSREQSPSA
jgi:hypothetical protein